MAFYPWGLIALSAGVVFLFTVALCKTAADSDDHTPDVDLDTELRALLERETK